LGDREVVIYKPRWGAFYGTCLEGYLKRNAVTTVVFCGCNFPNCPRASIYQASERDFRIAVVEDAVSGLYDRGRRELLNMGANVMITNDVISSLESAMTVSGARPPNPKSWNSI
jgi:nicotinamidase-related amidase